MKVQRPPLAVAAAAAALGAACAQPERETPMDNAATVTEANPFFAESTLPFNYPPFDRIDDSLYLPAFEHGMDEQLAEVEAIAAAAEAPTFENTLVALERSGRVLERVSQVFFNLNSADTNDTLDAIRSEIAPKLSAHSDRILLNGALFERVRALRERRDELGLDDESRRLVEEYYKDFVRAGAELPEADQERLREINAELAALETTFSQNVLSEVNAAAVVVDSREALAA